MLKIIYAIVDEATKEFYADPIYTDRLKAKNKIAYLENYRKENNMSPRHYVIEILSKRREAQHKAEWQKFYNAID